jgi:hypothetical protein
MNLKDGTAALLIRFHLFMIIANESDSIAQKTLEFFTLIDCVVAVHVGLTGPTSRDRVDVFVHNLGVLVLEGDEGGEGEPKGSREFLGEIKAVREHIHSEFDAIGVALFVVPIGFVLLLFLFGVGTR